MFPVVRLDTAGSSAPVAANRAASGRSTAASDDQLIVLFGPVEPSDSEIAASRLLGDKGNRQDNPGQQTPDSFFGRFQTPSEAFAAALNIKRLDEVAEAPRFDPIRAQRPFSGLVVQAVNLYESTAQFLADRPARGATINATS